MAVGESLLEMQFQMKQLGVRTVISLSMLKPPSAIDNSGRPQKN